VERKEEESKKKGKKIAIKEQQSYPKKQRFWKKGIGGGKK